MGRPTTVADRMMATAGTRISVMMPMRMVETGRSRAWSSAVMNSRPPNSISTMPARMVPSTMAAARQKPNAQLGILRHSAGGSMRWVAPLMTAAGSISASCRE